jgi:phage major head subunit gpT-like protein
MGSGSNASENNINLNRYDLIVSKRLRGAYRNYWFLADLSAPIKPCLFQLREEISTSAIIGGQGTQADSEARFKRGELWFGAEARYNVASFAFQTIVGSAVAA